MTLKTSITKCNVLKKRLLMKFDCDRVKSVLKRAFSFIIRIEISCILHSTPDDISLLWHAVPFVCLSFVITQGGMKVRAERRCQISRDVSGPISLYVLQQKEALAIIAGSVFQRTE